MRHRVIALSGALATLVSVATLAAGATTAATASAPTRTTAQSGHSDPTAPHRARAARRAPQTSRDASRTSGRTAGEDADPLTVTLDQLTPSTIPARGDIEVSGTVTNTDTSTWSTIKVYPFVSAEPMTTSAELEAAAATDPDANVGDRIVDDVHNATIDTLAPGDSASFDFSVPRGLLDATAPGVYWFGVQALGQGPDGRVDGADGRARTFLPLVPQQATGTVPVSVVLPLRRPIQYADDGSLTGTDGWVQSLSDGGRLRSLVDLGGSAGGQPVSWLVDPALLDAVRRLAAGNPPRSLQPNLTPDQATDPDASTPASPGPGDPGTSPSASAGSNADASPDAEATDAEPAPLTSRQLSQADAGTRALASAAQDWLLRLTNAVRPGDEVLVLPYGDTDVSAAADHAPRVYQVARARSDDGTVLSGLQDVQVEPAIDAPSGFLDPDALGLVDPSTTTLVTDEMFRSPPTTLAATDGRELVVTSTAAGAGGPGPDDPMATTAMRQRLLAEAAVRFLHGGEPLVTVLPHDWNPRDAAGYFSGLDASWLDLTTVAGASRSASPMPVAADDLRYPGSQRSAELAAANFEAADRLMAAGTSLQSLLTLNNLIAGTVRDEALVSTSYSARTHPDANRVANDRSRSWIDARLRRVTVSAPTAVNLLSSTGRFNTTVRNGLGQPVTVALDARTDSGLRVTGPRRVRVAARGIASVPLGARTDATGVHRVTLMLTDQRGAPLGSTTLLTVRSSQVSGIIWLFIALGAALLFGTIAVRLFRRVRAARRTGATRDAPPARPAAPGPPGPPGSPPGAPAGSSRDADAHPAGAGRR